MAFNILQPTTTLVSHGGEMDHTGKLAGLQVPVEAAQRVRPAVEGPLGEVQQAVTFKVGQQGLYSTLEFHVSVTSQVPNNNLAVRTAWADEDHQWLMETLNRRADDYNKLREVVGMMAPLVMPKSNPAAPAGRPVLL